METGRPIGYARTASGEASLTSQIKALQLAGCSATDIYFAKGMQTDSGKLRFALKCARSGDVFVVASLTSIEYRGLDIVLNSLKGRNIHFYSIAEQMDTRSVDADAAIQGLLHIRAFMHRARSESTITGLDAARAAGRVGGRRYALTNDQIKRARQLRDQGRYTMAEIAKKVGVSRSTLYLGGIGGTRNRPKLLKSTK
jgi:DNA invertase Pin-like site-specific DNA recombinase